MALGRECCSVSAHAEPHSGGQDAVDLPPSFPTQGLQNKQVEHSAEGPRLRQTQQPGLCSRSTWLPDKAVGLGSCHQAGLQHLELQLLGSCRARGRVFSSMALGYPRFLEEADQRGDQWSLEL